MNKSNILFLIYLIIVIFSLIGAIASEVQLVCLNKGQTIEFSKCNPIITDRTCDNELGCNYCASFSSDSGIYCPANINVCNSIGPSCTNLAETPEKDILQRKVLFDVAYVVKNDIGVDRYLLDELAKNGYTYEVIFESNVKRTNFDNYYIILVGNQNLDNPKDIPVDKHKSLIVNSYDYYKKNTDQQLGWSGDSGSASSPTTLTVRDNLHPIVKGLPVSFASYNINDISVKTSLLKRNKPQGINIIVSISVFSDIVIAAVNPGVVYLNGNIAEEKSVFFGITEARYWTDNTKKLFRNSLDWLVNAFDLDEDGFSSDVDCNDRDPNINPGSYDVFLNCKNDAPILEPIHDLVFFIADKVAIPVNVIDPENNALIYKINDSRFVFNVENKSFYWQPGKNDEGKYKFIIEVSDGEFKVDEIVSIEVKNNPPQFNFIPNLTWNEDTNVSIDLNEYFFDVNEDLLTFGVESSSSNSNIDLLLLGKGIYEFIPKRDWFGEDWIKFYAFDGKDKTFSNRIELKVENINDAPQFIKRIENISWDEDAVFSRLNLDDYFYDSDSVLSYSFSGNKKINIKIENGRVVFSQPKDWFGAEKIKFIAKDEKFNAESNEIILTVIDKGEPPVFSEIKCLGEINEDKEYFCEMDATDLENDGFTFSVGEEDNLKCNFIKNVLSYKSKEDYFGIASCEVKVSDKDGFESKIFEVNISNVNDAPRIISNSPEFGVINIAENSEQLFKLDVEDADGDNYLINWQLDNIEESSEDSYLFKKPKGVYSLEAIISDSISRTYGFWSVIVKPIEEFSCSEVNGNICSNNEICNGDFLHVKDQVKCCSLKCEKAPPSFKDIDACKVNDDSLSININSINDGSDIKIGDNIDVKIDISNSYNETQNLDVEVFLYDLDEREIIDDDSLNALIEKNEAKTVIVNLEVPEDIDLDDDYAILVKAEDNICNQKYKDIKIIRNQKKLEIINFEVPEIASCGEQINARVEVENLGLDDQEFSLIFKSNALKIDEKIQNIKIEKYGDKNKIIKEFSAEIPGDQKEGEYELAIILQGNERLVQTKNFKLNCLDGLFFEKANDSNAIKLESIVEEQSDKDESMNRNTIVLALMLLTSFVSIAFLFLSYKIFYREKYSERTK